jgi:hypothetical protein
VDEAIMQDYVVGAGGIYTRGRRPGLEVCMPVAGAAVVRGLKGVEPYVQWGYPKLPARFLERMLHISRLNCRQQPTESLFHLSFNSQLQPHGFDEHAKTLDFHQGWHLEYPEQRASAERCWPINQGPGSSEDRAIIEVHSHPYGAAQFSDMDDADEGGMSFRVYVVLGTIFERPTVRARVGLFGNFMEYPASEFFEMPEDLTDCLGG